MMQRNVFFKVRLLIPLCLWCVRFRHNNHLVRKKTRFGLKYQIVMDFLSKISSFWRHELVWKLSSVRLQMLSCRRFTFPTILSASWYRLGGFFCNFHLQLWLFVYANWKMCGNTSRWQCTDSNCAVDRTASVRMDHTELSLLRHYFALTVWNESRFLNLQPKRESFLLPTCCLLVRDTLSEFWDI